MYKELELLKRLEKTNISLKIINGELQIEGNIFLDLKNTERKTTREDF
ncbi:MAG: hypothetical protein FWF27_01005 [Candidatus Bathyarchaeota archaeon]|nr:hypothetical protein [Candidatus Termiticorpusculum sp.]